MLNSIFLRTLQVSVISWFYAANLQAQTAPSASAPAAPAAPAATTGAAAAPAASGGFGFDPQILMLVAIAAVFYFLLIRPQSQKAKRHREMLKTIKRGDRVMTAGGIIGTVAKVSDDTEVEITIAKDVEVTVARGTISDILPDVKAKTSTAAELNQAAKGENSAKKPSFFEKLLGVKPKAADKTNDKPSKKEKSSAKKK
ncbi:MAG: preprotein translocase subunit YajC [Alphaproteobacteria bacterium]|nr:preprotein translocase subunit YajC [Alphaproteobacteria bacterium]